MPDSKAYGTVLIKAKSILEVLLNSEDGLTLKEISTELVSPKSTTLKILNTMILTNLIWRDERDKRYYLGTELIAYGQKALKDFDVAQVAMPYLRELRNITNETVNLGVQVGSNVMVVEKLESPQSVNLSSRVGGKLRLYNSSMGKAILATKSATDLDRYFSEVQLNQVTMNTITSIETLKKELTKIQELGYAVDDKENQAEVVCVGATFVKHDKVFGAFSVSTPEYRLDPELLSDIKKLVAETKKQVEKRL